MFDYQKYESYETFLLYQEFLSIPDNPIPSAARRNDDDQ